MRNLIAKYFYRKDFFDESLPILSEDNFFGRSLVNIEIVQSLKRGENVGLFGLRKTGKTSLLHKVQRTIQNEDSSAVILYDCKAPFIRGLHYDELLKNIAEDASEKIYFTGVVGNWSGINAAKLFYKFVERLSRDSKRLYIIFDEIEYISYKSKTNFHWQSEFIDFWQTIWAAQSQFKNLSVMITGVNASVVEDDLVSGIQNPLFGVVGVRYLQGFSLDELKSMTRKFGKRMGLKFDKEVLEAIHSNYGGHPKISRMVLSYLARTMYNKPKPVEVGLDKYNENRRIIDSDITFYSQHVVSEIAEFYPDEYMMMEMLATEQIVDFKEFSREASYIQHLVNYGLLVKLGNNYHQSMPVVYDYIKLKHGNYVVPLEERQAWLENRKQQIISEMRNLERAIQISKTKLPDLFGINSFPEADVFISSRLVVDAETFTSFINSLNRTFVESIEAYGKSIGKVDYFWKDIKNSYTALWPSIENIKTYRNDADHLILNQGVSEKLSKILHRHLGYEYKKGENISFFIIQQRVLDEMLVAIRNQIEELNGYL